jgi:2,3-diketo-5-methylthio-1-phosphopentane phosphatase
MRIFCDFDGTITDRDTIAFLTESFGAGEEFRESILEEIVSERVSVFEAVKRELATVTATWEEAVVALREHVRIDPAFVDFADWCRAKEIPLIVVSSGMRPVVELYLADFALPLYAHPVDARPEGWLYRRDPSCDKKRLLERCAGRETLVYIGDGTSDVVAIPYADVLFAKTGRYLAGHCARHGIPFHPFRDFRDVRRELERLPTKGVTPSG